MARGVPRPVNDRVHDALVMRQVDLIRLSNGEAASLVTGVMRAADEKIVARLVLIEDPSRLTLKQCKRIEERLTNILAVQERQMRKRLNVYISDLAGAELIDSEALFTRIFRSFEDRTVKGASLGTAVARARQRPIRGVPMSRMFQRFFRNDRERVLGQFRAGKSDGLNTGELIRAIVGSRSRRFLDGVRQVSRRSIDTILQTITTHVSAQSRSLTVELQTRSPAPLITEERWVSTLDARTSEICQSLDGQVFPVGEGIFPPAHPNCRSARMPIVPGLQAFPKDETQFLPSTVKESFDGKGPQVLTYQKWLTSQPAAAQRDILGPSRFALFKTGEIELSGFVNDRNVKLTLDELRARSPKIFTMAGLDD